MPTLSRCTWLWGYKAPHWAGTSTHVHWHFLSETMQRTLFFCWCIHWQWQKRQSIIDQVITILTSSWAEGPSRLLGQWQNHLVPFPYWPSPDSLLGLICSIASLTGQSPICKDKVSLQFWIDGIGAISCSNWISPKGVLNKSWAVLMCIGDTLAIGLFVPGSHFVEGISHVHDGFNLSDFYVL